MLNFPRVITLDFTSKKVEKKILIDVLVGPTAYTMNAV